MSIQFCRRRLWFEFCTRDVAGKVWWRLYVRIVRWGFYAC